jgi:hypothetical protein
VAGPDFYDEFVNYRLTYACGPDRQVRHFREFLQPLLARSAGAPLALAGIDYHDHASYVQNGARSSLAIRGIGGAWSSRPT